MSKLRIWLREDDTLSSIAVLNYRALRVKRPSKRSKVTSLGSMIVMECQEHNELSPTITLGAYKFTVDGDFEGQYVGKRKICVMCWTILDLA